MVEDWFALFRWWWLHFFSFLSCRSESPPINYIFYQNGSIMNWLKSQHFKHHRNSGPNQIRFVLICFNLKSIFSHHHFHSSFESPLLLLPLPLSPPRHQQIQLRIQSCYCLSLFVGVFKHLIVDSTTRLHEVLKVKLVLAGVGTLSMCAILSVICTDVGDCSVMWK